MKLYSMTHGMEFQAIYDTRDKVKEILKKKDIKFTELKPKESFLYKMLEKEIHKRDGTIQFGYGLCGGKCRWGTSEKTTTITRYLKSKDGENYKEYVRHSSR